MWILAGGIHMNPSSARRSKRRRAEHQVGTTPLGGDEPRGGNDPSLETARGWNQAAAGKYPGPEHAENIFHKLLPGTHPLLDNASSWKKPQARKRPGLEPARGWKTPWLEQALGWNKAFCLAKPCKSHNLCSFKFWMTKSNTSKQALRFQSQHTTILSKLLCPNCKS